MCGKNLEMLKEQRILDLKRQKKIFQSKFPYW
jgi:hypothetical protein